MKILIPLDGSDSAKAALENVIARPWPQNSEVKVLDVVEPPSLLMGREMAGPGPEFKPVWEGLRDQAKDLVSKAAEKIREVEYQISMEMVEADPKSQVTVVRYAHRSVEITRKPS